MGNISIAAILGQFAAGVGIGFPDTALSFFLCGIFLRKIELLKPGARNFPRILIPALVIPAVLQGLTMLAGLDERYLPFLQVIPVCALASIVFKASNLDEYIKAFLCSLLGIFIVISSKALIKPVILYGTSVAHQNCEGVFTFALIYSLPVWLVLLGIIVLTLVKEYSFIQTDFLVLLTSSRPLRIAALLIGVFNILYLFFTVRLVYVEKILAGFTFEAQVAAIVALLIFPLINIFNFLWIIYYIKDRDARERFNIQEELRVSIADIRFFLRRGEYGRIDEELKYLERSANELFSEIPF